MFPEAFIKRIKKQEYIDAAELLDALQEPSPVSIRINRDKWKLSPLAAERVPWCPDGYYLAERPSFTLDPLFHAGAYYPQEASGMFLEQVIRQVVHDKEKLKILDLCAAPGGKSTHLSSLTGPDSVIVANDVIKPRADILAENHIKWGLSNTMVTQSDPSAFETLKGFFDIILVDAPYSGEGMFRNKTAIREWSIDKAIHCASRQKRVLMDIWSALKENGILIYSTCTFNSAENEENVKWLSERHESESIRLNISDFKEITEISHKGVFGYGFHPGKIKGEGLFIAVLKKKEKISAFTKNNKSVKWNYPGDQEKKIAEKWSEFSHDRLIKENNNIIYLPVSKSDYSLIARRVRILMPGTSIFTQKNKNLIPAHELALSVNFKRSAFPHSSLDLHDALAYLSRKELSSSFSLKGWNVISYRNLNLGFINNLGNRINNYYPSGWRIKMNYGQSVDEILRWENCSES